MKTIARNHKKLTATALATSIAVGAGAVACSQGDTSAEDEQGALTDYAAEHKAATREVVQKKAVCPFVGTMLAMEKLLWYRTVNDPFANLTGTGSVEAIGSEGGGDLGFGLQFVSRNDHGFDPRGAAAPVDSFSLEFPGTRGVHAGNSYILVSSSTEPDTGRLSVENLQRFIGPSSAYVVSAPDGSRVIPRSRLGAFAAKNVLCDPASLVDGKTIKAIGADLRSLAKSTLGWVGSVVLRESTEYDVTRIRSDFENMLVNDNSLLKSAAEMGLLAMLLEPSPRTRTIDGEPAFSVEDIEHLFAGVKDASGKYDPLTRTIPEESIRAPKNMSTVLKHSVFITYYAAKNYYFGAGKEETCPKRE